MSLAKGGNTIGFGNYSFNTARASKEYLSINNKYLIDKSDVKLPSLLITPGATPAEFMEIVDAMEIIDTTYSTV
jgi:ERCC4-related helicase